MVEVSAMRVENVTTTDCRYITQIVDITPQIVDTHQIVDTPQIVDIPPIVDIDHRLWI